MDLANVSFMNCTVRSVTEKDGSMKSAGSLEAAISSTAGASGQLLPDDAVAFCRHDLLAEVM